MERIRFGRKNTGMIMFGFNLKSEQKDWNFSSYYFDDKATLPHLILWCIIISCRSLWKETVAIKGLLPLPIYDCIFLRKLQF